MIPITFGIYLINRVLESYEPTLERTFGSCPATVIRIVVQKLIFTKAQRVVE